MQRWMISRRRNVCVLAVRYLDKYGWVGAKNRDRTYTPKVLIKKSFRGNTERLYIWDDGTKWTEGINEYGIAILSVAAGTPKDMKKDAKPDSNQSPDVIFSADGKKIRDALFKKNIKSALNSLIENGIVGNTAVFTQDSCFLIEAINIISDGESYRHKVREFKKDEILVRTNHGIMMPKMGYQMGDSRKSSEARYEKSKEGMLKASNPKGILDAISQTNKDDPQLGPLRNDKGKKDGNPVLKTTGQIMIIPKSMSLHYRPIDSKVEFDFDKLNDESHKTKFEVITSKKLLSVNETLTFRTHQLGETEVIY